MVIRQERWLSVEMVILAFATLAALLLAGVAGYELRGGSTSVSNGTHVTVSPNPAQYNGGSDSGKNPG